MRRPEKKDGADGSLCVESLTEAGSASQQVELGALWHSLVSGRYFVVSTLYSESRCFMSLVERRELRPRPSAESIQVLERVLSGETQKSIAISIGKAVSTTSIQARKCLEHLSRDHRASRPSMMLTMAAYAARNGTPLWARVTRGPDEVFTISVPRADNWMADKLTPAELAVARLLVEGRSHAEISLLRRTSARTTANQLASVFRRLEVSGRCELMALLARNAQGDAYPRDGSPASAVVERALTRGIPSPERAEMSAPCA